MWPSFWDWLAKLPPGSASFVGTLAGSMFGLIALLLGALFNAHLNRRRDDRLRAEDRVALACTLYAELVLIHRTLVENAQHLTDKPPDPDGGFTVPQPSIKFFPEMLSKMGLLHPDTIGKVMAAYILTEQYLQQLILLGGRPMPNVPEDRPLVYLDAQFAEFVIDFNRTRAALVKEAMDALTPYVGERIRAQWIKRDRSVGREWTK
jgi:hypothetical protein